MSKPNDLDELLVAYADGELDAARRAEVEAMLADPAHYGEPGALEALAAEHATFDERARALEARWEEIAADLETFTSASA